MKDSTYRAGVGERTFDIQFSDGALTIDDGSADFFVERRGKGFLVLWLDGRSYALTLRKAGKGGVDVSLGGRTREVRVQDERALLLERYGLADAAADAEREIHAPMPGLVLKVDVEEGQEVAEGDGLLVLEAMKMENELRAPADGTVSAVHIAAGDAVGKNELLIEIDV